MGMDEELALHSQKVRFSREATIALYRDVINMPGADRCTCTYCRNFAAQRNKAYPEEFLHLLNQLGANSLKEWEAFEYGIADENPKTWLYGGWFLFCGKLIEGTDHRPKQPKPFAFWFTSSFPNATLPKNQEICAVEFLAEIPWVLAEMPDAKKGCKNSSLFVGIV